MTFGGLFATVATAGGAPPGTVLTPAQRLGAVAAAVAERRGGDRAAARLRPASPASRSRWSACSTSCRGRGLSRRDVEAAAGTLEGSAYLGDIATLFAGYAQVRDRLGTVDAHGIAREAIGLLEAGGGFWRRPVFLYGLDDLTRNQLDLIRAPRPAAEVTVALPYEEGHTALAARNAPLLEAARGDRDRLGRGEPRPTPPTRTRRSSSTSSGASARPSRSAGRPTRASSSCARPARAARPRRSPSRWRACSPTGPTRSRSRSSCATRRGAAR